MYGDSRPYSLVYPATYATPSTTSVMMPSDVKPSILISPVERLRYEFSHARGFRAHPSFAAPLLSRERTIDGILDTNRPPLLLSDDRQHSPASREPRRSPPRERPYRNAGRPPIVRQR